MNHDRSSARPGRRFRELIWLVAVSVLGCTLIGTAAGAVAATPVAEPDPVAVVDPVAVLDPIDGDDEVTVDESDPNYVAPPNINVVVVDGQLVFEDGPDLGDETQGLVPEGK
ncbi:MAG: hypothetical protein LCH96_04745 [Actinobacteria bacterium]|nr:hypothetical protein [Actinomycetota bacterium]